MSNQAAAFRRAHVLSLPASATISALLSHSVHQRGKMSFPREEQSTSMKFNRTSIKKIASIFSAGGRNASEKSKVSNFAEKNSYASQEHQDLCYPFFELLDFLHVYYIPAIVVIGICCNILNFYVFLNTHLKHRSSSYYLAALAISDVGYLVSLGMIWIGDSTGVQTFNRLALLFKNCR